jgi:ParB family chromosome partitioning protein
VSPTRSHDNAIGTDSGILSRPLSEGLNVQLIPLDAIRIGDRKRTYRPEHAAELAASIEAIGLQQPITVVAEQDDGYRLVAGLHRLEAFRILERQDVPASILALDDLDRELAEIEENVRRRELTPLELGEHLLRRDEILRAKGERKPSHRPKKGATVAPFQSTADLAEDAGISERSAQRAMAIARGLTPAERDLLRPTPFAERTSDLEYLAKIKKPADRRLILEMLTSGKVGGVHVAVLELRDRHKACDTCGKPVDRGETGWDTRFWHCDGCGGHEGCTRWICGRCGHENESLRRLIEARQAQASVLPGSGLPGNPTIVGSLPQAFYSKKGAPQAPLRVVNGRADDTEQTSGSGTPLSGALWRVEQLGELAEKLASLDAAKLGSDTPADALPDVVDSMGRVANWLGELRAAIDARLAGQGAER